MNEIDKMRKSELADMEKPEIYGAQNETYIED